MKISQNPQKTNIYTKNNLSVVGNNAVKSDKSLQVNSFLWGNNQLSSQLSLNFKNSISFSAQKSNFTNTKLINKFNNTIAEIDQNITDVNFDNLKIEKKLENGKTKLILPEKYKKFEDNLNTIIEIIPEFAETIGRKQFVNPTYPQYSHKNTLDIHILDVLQRFIKNDDYKNLSEKDKYLGKIAILTHDVKKDEGVNDKNHPFKSAIVAQKIGNRLNLSAKDRKKIRELVENHHWSQNISEKKESIEDVALKFKQNGTWNIAKIFAKVDLKSVSDEIYEKLKDTLGNYTEEIQKLLNEKPSP
ncbi:MAG: hypothetical protein A2104_07495 [Candidatus Melainabacteria bacterium GWF2_32_7]|nr:MAG: hypothetical protein A2104_07495 [Candidatus Melainabacteria bacterium GWF2_32_7]